MNPYFMYLGLYFFIKCFGELNSLTLSPTSPFQCLFSSGLPCAIQSVSDDKIVCRTAKHEMNSMTVYPGEKQLLLLSSDVKQLMLDLIRLADLCCAVSLSEQQVRIRRSVDHGKNSKHLSHLSRWWSCRWQSSLITCHSLSAAERLWCAVYRNKTVCYLTVLQAHLWLRIIQKVLSELTSTDNTDTGSTTFHIRILRKRTKAHTSRLKAFTKWCSCCFCPQEAPESISSQNSHVHCLIVLIFDCFAGYFLNWTINHCLYKCQKKKCEK